MWACCLGQMVCWGQVPGTKKTLLSSLSPARVLSRRKTAGTQRRSKPWGTQERRGPRGPRLVGGGAVPLGLLIHSEAVQTLHAKMLNLPSKNI